MLDEKMRGLRCEAIECDELWSFIGKKQRNLTFEDQIANPDYGDCYTFIAFDPDTKVVPVFTVGKRDPWTTEEFIKELRARVTGRPQISTDGYLPYIVASDASNGSGNSGSCVVTGGDTWLD
jgi:IS1 family transposase